MERDKRVRLYQLAKEWHVESKVLVELCQQLGITAANQLAGLDPTEVTRLRDAVRTRSAQPAPRPAVSPRTPTPVRSTVPPKSSAAPAKPVPAVLVAPVPAPVWTQTLNGPPVATRKPSPEGPVAQSAQTEPPPASRSAVPLVPPPGAKPGTSTPPVPPPVPGRSAPRPPALPSQPKVAAPAQPPAPAPVVPMTSPVPAGPGRNPGIEQLLAIGTKVGLPELDLIPRLAEVDPESAVFKIQQLTERVCRKVLGAKGPRKLDVMVGEIEQRNLLGKKAVSYLQHLQNLGNHAAHNTDESLEEEFTLLDVNNAAATLASVLEAAISAKRIGTR